MNHTYECRPQEEAHWRPCSYIDLLHAANRKHTRQYGVAVQFVEEFCQKQGLPFSDPYGVEYRAVVSGGRVS